MSLHTLINQKSYEKIVFTVRRHPITFIPSIVFFALLLAAPIGLYWLISNSSINPYLQTQPGFIIAVLGISMYYLSCLVFFYTNFVEFHLDLWIVTNDRLLDIEQKTLFHRTIAEVDLYQIQDASSEIKGIFPTIFNYGNIVLQTAGPLPKFLFRSVANPNYLREEILRLAAEDRKFHGG